MWRRKIHVVAFLVHAMCVCVCSVVFICICVHTYKIYYYVTLETYQHLNARHGWDSWCKCINHLVYSMSFIIVNIVCVQFLTNYLRLQLCVWLLFKSHCTNTLNNYWFGLRALILNVNVCIWYSCIKYHHRWHCRPQLWAPLWEYSQLRYNKWQWNMKRR